MYQNEPISKVCYRPIEAAIRWAGLLRYETTILAAIQSPIKLPETLTCPRRDVLQLCLERIYDGILNGDLPYGENGITRDDSALFKSENLTVRHVDLKAWMHTYYPDQHPDFLFSHFERMVHPTITVQMGKAILVERDALQVQLKQCQHQLATLPKPSDAVFAYPPPLSERAETTYLHIIGAMLELLLMPQPMAFRSQDAIVTALVARYRNSMGISERTLSGKFAKAKRSLASTIG